jgi:hypothetical protein
MLPDLAQVLPGVHGERPLHLVGNQRLDGRCKISDATWLLCQCLIYHPQAPATECDAALLDPNSPHKKVV